MLKVKIIASVLALLVVLLWLVVSCGGQKEKAVSPATSIAGTWQNVDYANVTLEIRRQGDSCVITLTSDSTEPQYPAVLQDSLWLIGEPFAGAMARQAGPDSLVISHGDLKGIYRRLPQ